MLAPRKPKTLAESAQNPACCRLAGLPGAGHGAAPHLPKILARTARQLPSLEACQSVCTVKGAESREAGRATAAQGSAQDDKPTLVMRQPCKFDKPAILNNSGGLTLPPMGGISKQGKATGVLKQRSRLGPSQNFMPSGGTPGGRGQAGDGRRSSLR